MSSWLSSRPRWMRFPVVDSSMDGAVVVTQKQQSRRRNPCWRYRRGRAAGVADGSSQEPRRRHLDQLRPVPVRSGEPRARHRGPRNRRHYAAPGCTGHPAPDRVAGRRRRAARTRPANHDMATGLARRVGCHHECWRDLNHEVLREHGIEPMVPGQPQRSEIDRIAAARGQRMPEHAELVAKARPRSPRERSIRLSPHTSLRR